MPQQCTICGFPNASEMDFKPSEMTSESPPELLSLIRSHNPPSDIQASQIRRLLTESEEALRDLDQRISEMRRALAMLVRQRAIKTRDVEEHRSALHPIRRLPREILCEIFLSFVNEELEKDLNHSSLDSSSTIWILPQVSGHWRSVALSFARMWSTVRLMTDDFDLSRISETNRKLEVQLDRSANHQLSVCIFNKAEIPKSHPLLPILFSTSSHWKDLAILAKVSSFESFSVLKGSLPSMTTLHAWSLDQRTTISTSFSIFESAPKLTKILGHPHLHCKLDLPFSQITDYVEELRFTCIWHTVLLSLMPNLQRITTACAVSTDFDSETGLHVHRIPDTITLVSVSSANLRRSFAHEGEMAEEDEDAEHSTNDCPLMLRLTLPTLKELDIDLYHSVDGLRTLLRRSQCRLETLSLYVYKVPDDACIELLKDIPPLTSFTLDCTEALTMKFMEAFTQNPTIVPALRSLKLKNSCRFDSSQIEQLKASRPELSVVEICGTRY
ncbi:hypothetical protein C8J56DRAFT_593102 [Mycena floridula]|nr:hypothetical protein C8J56DRAFT_593102 [Mycena floridula]